MAVGGCAVYQGSISRPPAQSSEAPASRNPDETSPGQAAPRIHNPAVSALIRQAEQFIEDGEFQNAGAALERALRIDPRNAELYSRLAGVMLLQEHPDEAESLAKRSNSLASDWPGLQAKNWTIIARALRARGENASADAAEMRASQLKKVAGE